MKGKSPLIRAGFARTAMRRAGELSADLPDLLRERFGPELAADFDEAPLLGWMPYEIDVRMAEGILEAVGPSGLHQFVLGNGRAVSTQPAMNPILSSALRIFGMTPRSVLRVLPQLWSISYQNVATVEIIDGPPEGSRQRVTVLARDVCDQMLESKAAQLVSRAQIELVFRAVGTRGIVGPIKFDPKSRQIGYDLEWFESHSAPPPSA